MKIILAGQREQALSGCIPEIGPLKRNTFTLDLGSADYRFIGRTFVGTPHTTDSFPADLTFHTVRVGVNYKFDWAGPVVGRY